MIFTPQNIKDVLLIEPTIHKDGRGYFVETFRQDIFDKTVGYKVNFIQDNESKSTRGVVRGLHYQLNPYCQAKLVRVTHGKILDVVVDIRKSSCTFGKHVAVELSSVNKKLLFVPHGFAHGFVVISNNATITYKVDNYYMPKYDRGIAFDDEELSIDWKFPKSQLKLSIKDSKHPNLSETDDLFY